MGLYKMACCVCDSVVLCVCVSDPDLINSIIDQSQQQVVVVDEHGQQVSVLYTVLYI